MHLPSTIYHLDQYPYVLQSPLDHPLSIKLSDAHLNLRNLQSSNSLISSVVSNGLVGLRLGLLLGVMGIFTAVPDLREAGSLPQGSHQELRRRFLELETETETETEKTGKAADLSSFVDAQIGEMYTDKHRAEATKLGAQVAASLSEGLKQDAVVLKRFVERSTLTSVLPEPERRSLLKSALFNLSQSCKGIESKPSLLLEDYDQANATDRFTAAVLGLVKNLSEDVHDLMEEWMNNPALDPTRKAQFEQFRGCAMMRDSRASGLVNFKRLFKGVPRALRINPSTQCIELDPGTDYSRVPPDMMDMIGTLISSFQQYVSDDTKSRIAQAVQSGNWDNVQEADSDPCAALGNSLRIVHGFIRSIDTTSLHRANCPSSGGSSSNASGKKLGGANSAHGKDASRVNKYIMMAGGMAVGVCCLVFATYYCHNGCFRQATT